MESNFGFLDLHCGVFFLYSSIVAPNGIPKSVYPFYLISENIVLFLIFKKNNGNKQ